MRKYIRIGVDIAKNCFQVHALERHARRDNRLFAFISSFCTIPFGTVNAGEGRYRFLPRFCSLSLGHELGFLIAKSRFECRGRERERR